MLVKVEELTGRPRSRPPVPHERQPRHRDAGRHGAASRASRGSFEEYLARTFPTSTAADFAILEAGVTSEDTYVEQGLYWATGHVPMLEYVATEYKPDLLLVGMPTTDEFQHQFLGPREPEAAGRRARTRPTTTSSSTGPRTTASPQREAYIRTAYQEADEVLTLARSLVGKNPTTFVSSDHGFAPQFLAIDASKPLVDLGLQLGAAAGLELPHRAAEPAAGRHGHPDHGELREGEGVLGGWGAPGLPQRHRSRSRIRGRPTRGTPSFADGVTPNPNFMADPRVPADQVDARSSARSRTRSSPSRTRPTGTTTAIRTTSR